MNGSEAAPTRTRDLFNIDHVGSKKPPETRRRLTARRAREALNQSGEDIMKANFKIAIAGANPIDALAEIPKGQSL
jgi:hypothetical protein